MPRYRKPTPEYVNSLLKFLEETYPDAFCGLNYRTPLELLVATILSAQCTDERVNQVTPALFARYRTAQDFAESSQEELESYIASTGFYRNKAKNIIAACKMLVKNHNGEVPANQEELVKLAGVGRKTANVVLGDAFGIPGITVDTHVGRLSRRLGLTKQTDPVKVEFELMALIPQPLWTIFCHRLITHGRRVCAARKPNCESCGFRLQCPKHGVKQS